MTRCTLLALCLVLAGCGHGGPSKAEWGAIGAGLGASEALFRFDVLAGCWIIGRDGDAEEQSVSGVCQQPAK